MLTIEKIIEYSTSHPCGAEGSRRTVLTDGKVIMSIVGGCKGLYGDFKKDFEVALIDPDTGNFVTNYFVDAKDDVMPYVPADELVNLVNTIFPKGFQVQ